ncbi:MAG: ATP-binding cassette domain-containing protein, partial [Coriobacteriia bacterium]|nr:ATP-binding cassette domain-containing protein [Coriobacteriia bacterium]
MNSGTAGGNPMDPAVTGGDRDGHIIRVIGLKKRYRLGRDNYVEALRGASLTIDRGEMAAIMGPSGSGKSTLMHIAGCLDAADSGEVWLSGRRVDDLRGGSSSALGARS